MEALALLDVDLGVLVLHAVGELRVGHVLALMVMDVGFECLCGVGWGDGDDECLLGRGK